MNRVLGMSLAAAGVLCSSMAGAGEYEQRSIRVDASALDLSNQSGITELARQINRAVNRICGSDRYCREEAWESTEPQVAWAIDRDLWMRQLASERAAQLRACGWQGCAPQPVAYHPAPPPPPASGVVVTIVCPPPTYYAARW